MSGNLLEGVRPKWRVRIDRPGPPIDFSSAAPEPVGAALDAIGHYLTDDPARATEWFMVRPPVPIQVNAQPLLDEAI